MTEWQIDLVCCKTLSRNCVESVRNTVMKLPVLIAETILPSGNNSAEWVLPLAQKHRTILFYLAIANKRYAAARCIH